MTQDTLFLASNDEQSTLARIAACVFTALCVPESEERFSSNYPPDEHYFAGYGANAVIEVFDLADIKEGYPYCVSIGKPTYRKGNTNIPVDTISIGEVLAKTGLRVFVPKGQWASLEWDGEGTTYAL